MEKYYNKKQEDKDNFTEAYLMGKDWTMNYVPLYKIVFHRMKRFIKRKSCSFKKILK